MEGERELLWEKQCFFPNVSESDIFCLCLSPLDRLIPDFRRKTEGVTGNSVKRP